MTHLHFMCIFAASGWLFVFYSLIKGEVIHRNCKDRTKRSENPGLFYLFILLPVPGLIFFTAFLLRAIRL